MQYHVWYIIQLKKLDPILSENLNILQEAIFK